MTTATDVVNAAITSMASAKTAFNDAVATLHMAQDLAGIPHTEMTIDEMQALAAQATTLQQQNDSLTAANARLTTNLNNVMADITAFVAKAQADAAA